MKTCRPRNCGECIGQSDRGRGTLFPWFKQFRLQFLLKLPQSCLFAKTFNMLREKVFKDHGFFPVLSPNLTGIGWRWFSVDGRAVAVEVNAAISRGLHHWHPGQEVKWVLIWFLSQRGQLQHAIYERWEPQSHQLLNYPTVCKKQTGCSPHPPFLFSLGPGLNSVEVGTRGQRNTDH